MMTTMLLLALIVAVLLVNGGGVLADGDDRARGMNMMGKKGMMGMMGGGKKKSKGGSSDAGQIAAVGMVAVQSQNSFADTLSALEAALDGNPNINVIAKVPHSEAAQAAGLELLPNVLVVFGILIWARQLCKPIASQGSTCHRKFSFGKMHTETFMLDTILRVISSFDMTKSAASQHLK